MAQSSLGEIDAAAKQSAKTGSDKRRDQFLAVFLRHLKRCHINTDESMLVIGGSWQDIELLEGAGFNDITLSNLRPEHVEGEHRNSGFQVKRKTVSSYLAEFRFMVHPYPHWDFNVNAEHLSKRKETNMHWITSLIGAEVFLASLRILQTVCNLIPVLRGQGNKFFCCIEKSTNLQPWLVTDIDGRIAFHPGS